MKSDKVLQCRALTKRFAEKTALNGIDLEIGRGKIVGLLGPNGSGKTTIIKLANGLIQPSSGEILIDGEKPGPYSKSVISYLPDKAYFASWMKAKDVIDLFDSFYDDFNREKAEKMCISMAIGANDRIKGMSKGTKEKLQLILAMSRRAQLYLLDEPIAGVDPAARDFILKTIINNYNEEGTVIISTHLITDIERVLDEVVFIRNGSILAHETIDDIKEKYGMSVDEIFRELFKMNPMEGGSEYGW